MSKRDQTPSRTPNLFRMLEDKLELERGFGVDMVRFAESAQAAAEAPAPLAGKEPEQAASVDGSKAERLAALRQEMLDCAKCPLAATRTNLVFGVGNPDAELMFVGEAPGADEDAQGEPFVGRAGKLLDKIIAAMGFAREEVYIANILKCRPPGNRNPNMEEMACCMPYLEKQIAVIQPKLIVCLGGIAATGLLQTDLSVGRLRGRFHEYRGIPLLVTYHPAYLLRNPSGKAPVWEDMKMALRRLGRPVPE